MTIQETVNLVRDHEECAFERRWAGMRSVRPVAYTGERMVMNFKRGVMTWGDFMRGVGDQKPYDSVAGTI